MCGRAFGSVSSVTHGLTFCSIPRSFGLRTMSFAGILRILKRYEPQRTDCLANTAVEELALTGRSTLYSCFDHVIWNSDEWKRPRGESALRAGI